MEIRFRTAYGPKEKVRLDCKDKSLARQSMKQEADINYIVRKYQKTGVIEHLKKYEGEYGQFDAIDFHEAMNVVAEANSMFETVPSEIRARFDNDPGKFLDFVTDEKNRDEMVELGLARRPEVVDPPGELNPPEPPPEPPPEVPPAE